jgi:hypothetical protein
MSHRALAILAASFTSFTAQAAPILSSNVVVSSVFSQAALTQTGLPSLASDGNPATGFVVTSTVVVPPSPQSASQVYGFFVQWDYDLSSLGTVSSFTFSFTGIFNNAFGLNWLFVGPNNPDAPDGQLVTSALTLTSDGIGALRLGNYIQGNTLSIRVQTGLGTVATSSGSISLDIREVSADITATPLVVPPGNQVPEPSSLVLAFGALAIAAASRRRR